jgi:hypothetical protein
MLIRSEKQLHRVLLVYVKYFNEARPHQGIHQQVPQREVTSIPPDLGIGSSGFQSWVGYTTSTEEWPERFNSEAELLGESMFQASSLL